MTNAVTITVQQLGTRIQSRLAALVGNPYFWLLFTLFGMGIPIARTLRVALPKPLPILSTVPGFRLVDQNNEAFGSEHFPLVSFSVDPDHDTPAELLAYARTHRVSPRMWSFLTGSHQALMTTLNQGLKIYMGKESTPGDDLMSIGHGTHFVLVDSKMRIRGYYDLSDQGVEDALLRDAGLLASRGE